VTTAERRRHLRTVVDFGRQWRRFPTGHNEGFYGSVAHLADTFGPLLDTEGLRGARVAEIGSGPGRLVNMLLDAGVAHVTAVEPSEGLATLRERTRARADRITYVQATGEYLPLGAYDVVFSVGVVMHIPAPAPVMRRAWAALRPGGELLVWLYAREGNELYVMVAGLLRAVTTRLPDPAVAWLARGLNALLSPYIALCRWLPLPRHRHFRNVMAKMTRRQRALVIFDQLNPTYTRYYRRQEAEALLSDAGFVDVQTYHRHGYSWAVKGRRPVESA
jgi:SAM-dependent methyltransferase